MLVKRNMMMLIMMMMMTDFSLLVVVFTQGEGNRIKTLLYTSPGVITTNGWDFNNYSLISPSLRYDRRLKGVPTGSMILFYPRLG
jgi:hypothetical protein